MLWDDIIGVIKTSANTITMEQNIELNFDVLEQIGIPETSTLGQVILHVRKLVVNKYLRILGEDIWKINNKVKSIYPGDKTIIATDIWGGLFAISNGDFPGNKSVIWYYAPDTLQWESIDIDYPHFITWVLSKKFNQFHSSFMWSNIDDILNSVSDQQGIFIYPFLWANECNIETATKKSYLLTS